jgi:anaphase-promoting complex subunit 3
MEIYSTALWQLHDAKKLSALAAEMSEVAREQPETWCIAGNCFRFRQISLQINWEKITRKVTIK